MQFQPFDKFLDRMPLRSELIRAEPVKEFVRLVAFLLRVRLIRAAKQIRVVRNLARGQHSLMIIEFQRIHDGGLPAAGLLRIIVIPRELHMILRRQMEFQLCHLVVSPPDQLKFHAETREFRAVDLADSDVEHALLEIPETRISVF